MKEADDEVLDPAIDGAGGFGGGIVLILGVVVDVDYNDSVMTDDVTFNKDDTVLTCEVLL